MKVAFRFMLISLVFMSCGMMKQTKKTSDQSNQRYGNNTEIKSTLNDDHSLKSVNMVYQKDSSQTAWQIQLWPKGRFVFSAGKGFEGEAEKILITGLHRSESSLEGLNTSDEERKLAIKSDVKQKIKAESSAKKEVVSASLSWKWIVILLFIASAMIFWLLRKYRAY